MMKCSLIQQQRQGNHQKYGDPESQEGFEAPVGATRHAGEVYWLGANSRERWLKFQMGKQPSAYSTSRACTVSSGTR